MEELVNIDEFYSTEQERIKGYSKDDNSVQESFLKTVHIEDDVIPAHICDWIIEKAEEKGTEMGSWTSSRHKAYPTTDIPVVTIESIRNTLANIVYTDIFPIFSSVFGIEKYFLGINDLFVVKYDMYGQQSLEAHKDGSVFSFSILLNDPKDFEGGGTQIMSTKEIYKLNKGGVLVHSGYNRHAGVKITDGFRYLLVGFINYVPHLSCTCESCQKNKQTHWNKMNTKHTHPNTQPPPHPNTQPPPQPQEDHMHSHTHSGSCPQHPDQKHEWEKKVMQWEMQQEEDRRRLAIAQREQQRVNNPPQRSRMFLM